MAGYVCSGLEIAELDRKAVEEFGIPERVLLELAGRAVAEEVRKHAPEKSKIVVLCGPGNNGGDGFVCARALASYGYGSEVAVFAPRERLQGASREAFETLVREDSVSVSFIDDAKELWALSTRINECSFVVDALLGTGLKDKVRGLIADVIRIVNEADVPVVAVDLPSGIDVDTGCILGRAVQAKSTVTFAYPKRGHFLYPGKQATGDLKVADIGIPAVLAKRSNLVGRVIAHQDGPDLVPSRLEDSHKGSYGQVVVVGGSESTPGAAVLAASGALRSGSGLVSWATDSETHARAGGLAPEIMLRLRNNEDDGTWARRICTRADALVVGPGLGRDDRNVTLLREIFRRASGPMCLDADALTLMSENPDLWDEIQTPVVVTPHPREMARLLGVEVEDVQRDRFASALQLAVRRDCVVVLKGAGTVVADSDGQVTVLDAGNPGMATGGTGDVLAGVVAGFLAQGLVPLRGGLAGALLHSCAGDRAASRHGQAGMTAQDLLAALGDVFVDWDR